MEQYRIVNKLKFGDYSIAALVQLFKPLHQILFLAFSFLLSWMMCGILGDDLTITSTTLLFTLGLFIAMQLAFILLFSIIWKKNNDTVFRSLEYRYTEIAEEGLTECYAASASQVTWDKFKKIKESSRHFLLYTEKNRYMILPKQLLPDECIKLLRRVAAGPQNRLAAAQTLEEAPLGEGDIRVQITSRDRFSYQIYHFYLFRKSTILYSVVLLALIAVMFALSQITGEYLYPEVFLIMFAVLGLFPWILARITSKKEEDKNIIIRLRDNGFEFDSPFGKALIKWDKLYSARQTEHHYFLYLSAAQAVILPKRCLDTGAMERINDAIRQYGLGKKKNRA